MNKFSALLMAVLCLFVSQTNLLAQKSRNCGTMGHLELLQQKHPETVRNMEKIEAHTNKVLKNSSSLQKVNGVITIPVVVHVLYNTSAQNISDAQILSQIQVLNDDFRRTNADASNTPSDFLGVAADSQIEFCMATVDPSGNATDGITRKQTSNSSWSTNDAMKKASQGGVDPWATSDYLNIWVCNLSGGVLGYAQFPGGPAATDGVVCLTTAFGTTGNVNSPFDLGRTTTHEVGHWLNLRHIWGDGNCNADDLVSDTPTAGSANYTGAPCTYPGPNTCSTGANDLPDMFQNYMDYSDDGCMNLYTTGQKDRMRALFDAGGSRVSLLSSTACGTPTPDHCTNGTLDSDETGIDCGGADCDACPTCTDGIQNGDETGIDCGGSCPTSCPISYCGSQGDDSSYEYISNVSIGTINNNSGSDNGYGDYTSLATDLSISSSNVISLTPAFSGTTYNEYWEVYIDYNGDGDFTDSGEKAYDSGSASSSAVSGTITIPAAASVGLTRMRIQMRWNQSAGGPCTTFAYGEVEDYSVNIVNNGGGGPTCTDGVLNGDETGIDCGGPDCDACPTCSDGVLNGNETDIDCGGSDCDACPTCSDNIMNGDETGIDCGGSCDPCGGGGECTYSVIDDNGFESGWGIWNDGGSDSRRINNATYASTGTRSIRLRDNTNSSVMTTDNLNLTAYEELTVSFGFVAVSMDNSNEDFWLQISTNGGSSYTTVEEWNRGDEFENNNFYTDAVSIDGPFTSNTRLRFRCDASGNSDWVYIDDVLIEGCSSGNNRDNGSTIEVSEELTTIEKTADLAIRLFPNPVKNTLNVAYDNVSEEATSVTVYDMTGRVLLQQAINATSNSDKVQLDVSDLKEGYYLLKLNNGKQSAVQKFFVF